MISVLMCVYNAENWVQKSIESVIAQDFNNWEFIIVNDGSTDNTEKIIKSYSIKDNKIKIYNKENTGLTKSLN